MYTYLFATEMCTRVMNENFEILCTPLPVLKIGVNHHFELNNEKKNLWHIIYAKSFSPNFERFFIHTLRSYR